MNAPVILLDFAAPRVRHTLPGMLILILGLAAVSMAGREYYSLSAQRAGLELKLAAALQKARPDPGRNARNARALDEAAGVAVTLGTPWTHLLADLELVTRDAGGRIALLAIEPDQDKQRVRVSGESKDLAEALDYLSRLQAAGTLKYPLLDSHEIVADDKERPVRFTLTADWVAAP